MDNKWVMNEVSTFSSWGHETLISCKTAELNKETATTLQHGVKSVSTILKKHIKQTERCFN